MERKSSIKVRIADAGSSGKEEIVRFVDDGYRLYFNCQHLLITLSPIARCFFDYLCETMRSDNNEITANRTLHEHFISHLGKLSGNKYQPSYASLNKYIKQFRELNLLLFSTFAAKEFYIVNPKYAYKGGKGERLKLLKKLIEERMRLKMSLQGLIDKTEVVIPE